MPQKLQKEVSTDCRVLPAARPHCPSSAEGEGALCSSGALPGGSCTPLTCSFSDTSNILVDIQPEVNAASHSRAAVIPIKPSQRFLLHLLAASLQRRDSRAYCRQAGTHKSLLGEMQLI